jgi:hypothetical protein
MTGKSRIASIALAALLPLLPGCVTDQGYLSFAATQPVPLDVSDLEVDTLPVVRSVEGSHTAVTSVLFVPTYAGPRLDLAVEDALLGGHGDVLTRAEVETTRWWFLIGVETLRVRGNVIDVPGVP